MSGEVRLILLLFYTCLPLGQSDSVKILHFLGHVKVKLIKPMTCLHFAGRQIPAVEESKEYVLEL
jgi:hypothetical protein